MTFTPATIGLTQAAVLEAGMMGTQAASTADQAMFVAAESIAPASYSLSDDGSKLRYVVGGLGVVTLTAALAGCDAPQPATSQNPAQASQTRPANQGQCPPDGGGSPFCRNMARTEQRIENMTHGVDVYANHNRDFTYAAYALGVLSPIVLVGLYFTGRAIVRKVRGKNRPKTAQPPAPPTPDVSDAGKKNGATH